MEKRRVVVTGMGAVTPLGIGVDETWSAMLEGKSGVGLITQFDAAAFATKIAGEVKGFDPALYIEAKEIKKMDRFIHLAIAASRMAMEQSGLQVTEANAERVGVMVGSGMGGLIAIEKYHAITLEKGPRKITPFFIPMLIVNLASGHISIIFGAKGPNSAVVTACATGTHNIGDAFKIIQRGDADAMIAGGTEACVTPMGIGGFNAMKALSTRNDEPQRASRPFDAGQGRVYHGRGRGAYGARRAGARQGARGQYPGGACRIRPLRRRLSPDRAGPQRRRRGEVHQNGHEGRLYEPAKT